MQTDEQMLDIIRASFESVLHASCTCKMGRANDTMTVLDSRARVYGVQSLRVVDASSFPLLPPGHPQATICKFSSVLHHTLQGPRLTLFEDGLAEKIATDIIT